MEIAHGTIRVDLDDKEAIRGLRALDAEFDRAMAKIEREHATATIEGDLKPLEDKLANAKRQLKQLEGQKATVEVDGDTDELDKAIVKAKAAIKAIDGEKATVELKVKGEENVRKAQEAYRRRMEAMEKEAEAAVIRQAKLQAKADKEKLDAVNRDAKVRTSLNKQRMKEEAAAAKAEADAAKEKRKSVNEQARVSKALRDQEVREMRQAEAEARKIDKERSGRALKIANLRKAYARSIRDVEKQAFRKTPLGREAKIELELDRNAAKEKMLALKAELNAIGGHPPVGIGVDVDRKDRVGQWFLGLIDRFRELSNGGRNFRVALGPISAGLTTIASAALILAPALVALAGAFGALVAVFSSAVLGLGALTLGFTGGLIPAAVGVLLVVKPMIKKFQEIKKAQDAYNTAIDKFGEGSKQAQAAHHKMRILLGHVDEETIKAIENAGKLGARWRELTKPSQAVAFNVIGQALRTAAADLKTFATGTNRVFGAAGKAIEGWLKGLRTSEAKEILGNLMGNFAKTVGPLADGLGSVFTWLSRIANVASNALPGVAKGFADWAKGIADSAKDRGAVQKSLDRMFASLKSVGRLAVSAGKFLAAFFDGGVESGQNLADAFSDTLDSWTEFLKSTKGKQELKDFFSNAVKDAERIVSIIADIGEAFYAISEAVQPVIQTLADIWDFLVKIATWKTPDWGIQAQKDAIDAVKQSFVDFWNRTVTIFNYIKSQASVVGSAIASIARAVGSAAGTIGKLASKSVKVGIQFASGGIDKAKSAIGGLAGLSGKVIKIGFQFAVSAVTSAIALVRKLLALGGRAVAIAASFASGVISAGISIVRKLLGFGGRAVSIGARFAAGVISKGIALVNKLLSFTGRVVSIGARFASGVISGAINLLNQLMSFAGKVVNVAVHVSMPNIPSPASIVRKIRGKASGGGADDPGPALIGEGRGPEIMANRKTGLMTLIKQPMITNLSKDDYIIPTEAQYRDRGKKLMSMFAKDMGIPGFKAGHPPKPLSEHGKSVARGQARKTLTKSGATSNKGAYTEITRVQTLQDSEATQRAKIQIAESKLKEPSSFLLPNGVDAEGNPLFTVNTGEVNRWVNDLNGVKAMYDQLLVTMRALQAAVKKAIGAVKTAIQSAQSNLHIIAKLETHERNIIAKKGSSKLAIQKAKERLKVYKAEADAQEKVKSDASESLVGLKEEDKYTGIQFRIDQDTVARDEYVTDAAGVAAMAQAEVAGANPTPKTPEAVDPFAATSLADAKLNAESALTAIGQGSMSPGDIVKAQIANNQSIINIAKGLLTDADPTNDQSAYNAISSAAGEIQQLQASQAGEPVAPLGPQFTTLGNSIGSLMSSQGSNFSGGIRAGAAMASAPGPGYAMGHPGVAPAGAGGTNINVINNYQTQPVDPHTWSRNLLFELQAAS